MTQRKNCPFCANDNLQLDSWIVGEDAPSQHIEWSVACQNCGAYGPNDLGKSGAEEAWNIRRSILPTAMQIYALGLDDGWSVFEAHRPCMVGQGNLVASGLTEVEMGRLLKRRVIDTELKASVGVKSKKEVG